MSQISKNSAIFGIEVSKALDRLWRPYIAIPRELSTDVTTLMAECKPSMLIAASHIVIVIFNYE